MLVLRTGVGRRCQEEEEEEDVPPTRCVSKIVLSTGCVRMRACYHYVCRNEDVPLSGV